jgi:hypothetical protein
VWGQGLNGDRYTTFTASEISFPSLPFPSRNEPQYSHDWYLFIHSFIQRLQYRFMSSGGSTNIFRFFLSYLQFSSPVFLFSLYCRRSSLFGLRRRLGNCDDKHCSAYSSLEHTDAAPPRVVARGLTWVRLLSNPYVSAGKWTSQKWRSSYEGT